MLTGCLKGMGVAVKLSFVVAGIVAAGSQDELLTAGEGLVIDKDAAIGCFPYQVYAACHDLSIDELLERQLMVAMYGLAVMCCQISSSAAWPICSVLP